MEFMAEFARYLVLSGVTISQFTSVARTAYCQAASAEGRFRNGRLNQSAVAAMTGLTRAQVRELAQREREVPQARRDRLQNVIAGWTTDPVFTTAAYVPRRLSIGKKEASFSSLVRKYGGDVPARSILREMVRTGSATIRGRYIYLSHGARLTQGEARLQRLCQSLTMLLKEPRRRTGLAYPLRTVNCETTYPVTSTKGRILMQKRSAKSLRAFVADLQAAGSAAAVESPPSSWQKGWRTRTRVILISEELDPTNSLDPSPKN